MATTSRRTLLAQSLDLLEKAEELLGNGKNWTKGQSRKTLRAAKPARSGSGWVPAGYHRQTGKWEEGKYTVPPQKAQEAEYAYCMTGALNEATRLLAADQKARQQAEALLKKNQALISVPEFNDHRRTTFADVKEVIRRGKQEAKIELANELAK